MFNRTVHLGGWLYELEPQTGFTYATTPEGQSRVAELPRLEGPGFRPPEPHLMRDPSLPTTWPATGGTTIEVSGFRTLARPWSGRG